MPTVVALARLRRQPPRLIKSNLVYSFAQLRSPLRPARLYRSWTLLDNVKVNSGRGPTAKRA
jgi:hypothetical protein